MEISQIPVVTVSYNSPDLIAELLGSFRQHYNNPVYVVDGSEPGPLAAIRQVTAAFDNVKLIDFGYNIHHGPGLAYAITHLKFSGPVLFLDSDIRIVRAGFLESLLEHLQPGMYGVGNVQYVNREGFDVTEQPGAIPYLHPACMLCNIETMWEWPLPIKHGAPMVATMLALNDAGQRPLLGHVDWVRNDFTTGTEKIFIEHDWQGTVSRTGGYHLEEWLASVLQGKQQKPTAHPESYNRDLLALIPKTAKRLVEVGCNTGALAAAYKKLNPESFFHGIEIDAQVAEQARAHCDRLDVLDIEQADDAFFAALGDVDCWVFGEVLERLRDPWGLLAKIRKILPPGGSIVACIANAQHWSVVAKLGIGDFRYEDSGLLARSNLRMFTRATIFELFQSAGMQVVEGFPRILDEPFRERILPAVKLLAESVGADPAVVAQDVLPTQYVMRATPV